MRRYFQNILTDWLSSLRPRPAYSFTVPILFFTLLLSPFPVFHTHAQVPADDVHRILLLHSYHPDYPWTAEIDEGVHTAIDLSAMNIELFTEFMDMKRHVPEPLFAYLHDLYAFKYKNLQPDVIICSDDSAFDFLTRSRSDLFPGVPIVFCGISDLVRASSFDGSGITGVIEDFDLRGTLNIALEIQPDTKHVAVVSDSSPTGISHSAVFREIAPEFQNRLDLIYLDDLTAAELADRCSLLPDNTIVIVLSYFTDHEGNFYSFGEASEIIGQSCDFAIYTAWDFLVGYGAIGGLVTGGALQGEAAAQLALRILAGESPDDIPIVTESPKIVMLDYNALRKFGMQIPRLSRDQIVINEPTSFYYRHKTLVWFVFIFIVFEAIAIFLLFMNIRIRRNMEKALRESEARYRELFDYAGDAIIVRDMQGRILDVNRVVCERLGYSREEFLDLTLDDILTPEFAQLVPQRTNVLKAQGQAFFEAVFLAREGFRIPVELSSKLVDYSGSEAILTIARDVIDRKRAEEEIRRKNDELEAALKVKTEFLSMVSHELRTPLVPIIGYSEVLLDGSMGELPEDARNSVQTILNRSNDLAKLIEDLLVLSRFERGSLKLEIEPLPVLQHISEIVMDYRNRELKKDVTFTLEGPDIRVNADHTRLHQIITNLIDNAIKYSHDLVKIRIVTGSRDDMGLISVEDNGIGIQKEYLSNIFDRFFQVEAVDTRSRGGAGLGLAIIKDLAESMGGRITVKSEFGVGSTFIVELPLSKP